MPPDYSDDNEFLQRLRMHFDSVLSNLKAKYDGKPKLDSSGLPTDRSATDAKDRYHHAVSKAFDNIRNALEVAETGMYKLDALALNVKEAATGAKNSATAANTFLESSHELIMDIWTAINDIPNLCDVVSIRAGEGKCEGVVDFVC